MKNLVKITCIIIMVLLVNVESHSQVSSDYDKNVDFSNFHSYIFGGWEKDSGKLLNDLDKDRIHDAFTAEFKSRGLTEDQDKPDLVMTFYLVIDNKTSTTAYTSFNGGMGYGGYGMRAGWGWGMGSATTTYQENDYQVGTLVVDAYDANTKKLLWQGTIRKEINSNAKRRDKTIPRNVKKLMKKYPIDPHK